MAEDKADKTTKAQAPAESEKDAAPDAPPTKETAEKTPLRKKKINQMNAAEIDARLKLIQEQQGGLGSKYADQLQKRKKTLSA